MKEPSVTILVTVKNMSETVSKCVQSLLNLEYKNKKIFVVDAYSTDGTYELLRGFEKKIRLARVEGSVPKVYNWALKRIDTDFVAFTDADCVVDPNWIANLIAAFNSPNTGATGGFCKTPSDVSRLQRLIGLELEDRFTRFPTFVSRLPTMNLCVRTSLAKKLRFDEQLDATYDTDFGYRLNKLGYKIMYTPEAIVYHYHRASWKSFFKQQFGYGHFVFPLYLRHPKKAKGDHISKPSMLMQALLFLGVLFLLFLSIFYLNLLFVATGLSIILLGSYCAEAIKVGKSKSDFPTLLTIFICRTIAWTLGSVGGCVLMAKQTLLHRELKVSRAHNLR